MSVDFLRILKSLSWVGGGRKDLERKKGLLGKCAAAPQQGCLGFLEPLLNKVWRGKGPQSWGESPLGPKSGGRGGGRPEEQNVSLSPGKLSVLLRP